MKSEFNCDDIKFRWLPALYWKPVPLEVRVELDLDVWRRPIVLCFAWLLIEIELPFFAELGDG
jgi:hypothetical protein